MRMQGLAFQDAGASLVSAQDQELLHHLLAEWREGWRSQIAVGVASVWLWVVPWGLPAVYAS